MLITINSAKAGQRPLAGFGMGACFRDGRQVGSPLAAATVPGMGAAKGTQAAAAPVLPRVRWAVAATSERGASASASGAGCPASIQTKTKQFSAQQFEAQQFEHVTRAIPAYRGGVGSHPAREPEPV